MRDIGCYNAILCAIAGGACRLTEIAEEAGTVPTKLGFYLSRLKDLGIICQEKLIAPERIRRGPWAIADGLFSFWFRFIPECMNLIAGGEAQRAYDERIAPYLDKWFESRFARICADYLKSEIACCEHGAAYTDYGLWRGVNPATKQKEQIDLVAWMKSTCWRPCAFGRRSLRICQRCAGLKIAPGSLPEAERSVTHCSRAPVLQNNSVSCARLISCSSRLRIS